MSILYLININIEEEKKVNLFSQSTQHFFSAFLYPSPVRDVVLLAFGILIIWPGALLSLHFQYTQMVDSIDGVCL